MSELSPEVVDLLLSGIDKPDDLFGRKGIFEQLKKVLVERILEAEMSHHLGYEKGDIVGRNGGNSRNGHGTKRLQTTSGTLELSVPRDREGRFEPQVVKKRQTRLTGFDEAVISLYARGMSVREIQGHLLEIYGTEVSPDLISRVTDSVYEEVSAWQHRQLDPIWPIVYLDALTVKIRDQGTVHTKAAYLALGVNMEGKKEVLGIWISRNEGAKFWMSVITELRNRGVQDILIACCDGLKGFPEAIEAVFPQTTVQTCIVHMIRGSLRTVATKERKPVAADLKSIYQAPTAQAAEKALERFESTWDKRYPMIGRSWRANWVRVIPFFEYSPEIRRVIYTTNAIESLNNQLRKTLKRRGVFPHDESAIKLLWLALHRASAKWTMPIREWGPALQQLAIHFEGRVPI